MYQTLTPLFKLCLNILILIHRSHLCSFELKVYPNSLKVFIRSKTASMNYELRTFSYEDSINTDVRNMSVSSSSVASPCPTLPVPHSVYVAIVFTFLIAPLILRPLLFIFIRLLRQALSPFAAMTSTRQYKCGMVLLKSLFYFATFCALSPVTLQLLRNVADKGFETAVSKPMGNEYGPLSVILPFYIFELISVPTVSLGIVLHHVPTLLLCAMLLSNEVFPFPSDLSHMLSGTVFGVQVMMFSFVFFSGVGISMMMHPSQKKVWLLIAMSVVILMQSIILSIAGALWMILNARNISPGTIVAHVVFLVSPAVANFLLAWSTFAVSKKVSQAMKKQEKNESEDSTDENASSSQVNEGIVQTFRAVHEEEYRVQVFIINFYNT